MRPQLLKAARASSRFVTGLAMEWLPQRPLARFIVEVIDGLDLSELVKAYRGSARPPTTRQCCWG